MSIDDKITDEGVMIFFGSLIVYGVCYLVWLGIFIAWKLEGGVELSWGWLFYPFAISFLIFLAWFFWWFFGFKPLKKKSIKEK